MPEGGAQFSSGEVPIRSSASSERNKQPLTPIRSSSPDNPLTSQLGTPIRSSEKQSAIVRTATPDNNLTAQLGFPIKSSIPPHATLENLAQGMVNQAGGQPENTANITPVPQTAGETTLGEQTSAQENPTMPPQREQWQTDMEAEIMQDVTSREQYTEAVVALQGNRQAMQDMEAIVHGQLRGMPLQLNPVGREGTANYSEFQWRQRLQLIEQYRRNPALALAIVQRHIALGHGTSSASFIGFLDPEHGGLRTRAYLAEHNVVRATGEEGRAAFAGNTHVNDIAVSFEVWYEPETLVNYANGNVGARNYGGEILPNRRRPITEQSLTENITRLEQSLQTAPDDTERQRIQARLNNVSSMRELIRTRPDDPLVQLLQANFPTVYLARGEAIQRRRGTDPGNIVMFNSMSDTEVGIRDGVSRENTEIVLVPKNEVARMQHVFSQRNADIAVFPIEDYAHA